jgi:hypothetical protein
MLLLFLDDGDDDVDVQNMKEPGTGMSWAGWPVAPGSFFFSKMDDWI